MKAYPYMHKHPTSGQTTISEGMDLRDWFAGQAVIAFFSNLEDEASKHPASVAVWCYEIADEMMKQRKEVSDE